MYGLMSTVTFWLSVNDLFFSSLHQHDPDSLVLIVCKHQKSNIFWNPASARKSGLNPLCRFQNSDISCPSKRRPSLMGVSAARLWRWAGRRRSCGTSHDACQHSVVMRQCLRLFYLVISARCTVWEEREMHKYVWISRQATEEKKKKLRNCGERSPERQRSGRGKAHARPCDCLMVYYSHCLWKNTRLLAMWQTSHPLR